MLSVRWLAVWDPRGDSRTYLHLFPAARHVAAPYPIHIRVGVIGGQGLARNTTVEGAKIAQPILVDLAELFPGVREMCGVVIEVAPLPVRRTLDLTPTSVLVERMEGTEHVRYTPWKLSSEGRLPRQNVGLISSSPPEPEPCEPKILPGVVTKNQKLSLIVINETTNRVPVPLGLRGVTADLSGGQSTDHVPYVNPLQCMELPLIHREESFSITVGDTGSKDVALYLASRNAHSGALQMVSHF